MDVAIAVIVALAKRRWQQRVRALGCKCNSILPSGCVGTRPPLVECPCQCHR
jgi:hypothetical protein